MTTELATKSGTLEGWFREIGRQLSACKTLDDQHKALTQMVRELNNLSNAVNNTTHTTLSSSQIIKAERFIACAGRFFIWAGQQKMLVTTESISASGIPAEFRDYIRAGLSSNAFQAGLFGGKKNETPQAQPISSTFKNK